MGRWSWRASVVVVLLVLAVAAPAPAPAEASAGGLRLVQDEVLSEDGRLHRLTLHSDALERETDVRILLPAAYADPARADVRYPVLLLVHGVSGSERDWTERTDVEGTTADDDLIVVMPDGGTSGFYSDWRNGPAWESFHLGELVPWVDATYRTVGTREGRAVAGLSMGGFGAMSYAARHPDRFVAAAAFSGAVDLAGLGAAEGLALQQAGLTPDDLWGSYLTDEATWRSHNPADLVRNLRGVVLRHTTGTGVPCVGDRPESGTLEAAIHPMNVSFDLKLTQAGVAHEYLPRLCGTHEWHHWEAALTAWLPTLLATFADPPPPPAAFDHRSAEQQVSVWGWSFTAHRPAVELLDLTGVSPAGLSLTGSGPVDVVTPPTYVPGASYLLTSRAAGVLTVPVGLVPPLGTVGAGPVAERAVSADDEGRLAFTVDLGPAHTVNQWSPEGVLAEAAAPGAYLQTATVTIAPVPGPPPAIDPASASTSTAAAGPTGTLPATGGGPAPWWAAAALLVGLPLLRRAVGHAVRP
jgi:S-formylglutathione hydrolase FrmB